MTRRARLFLGVLLLATMAQGPAQAADITVFAAASLKTALDAVAADWQAEAANMPDSRTDLPGNTLVLIAHGDHAARVVDKGLVLAGMLDGGKLATAMADSVPAGQYGKEALITLGLWPTVQASVVQSENVRAALVASGEAPYRLVFR